MPSDRPLPPAPLSVGEAARRLRVSPAALRAWERRYGLGPSARTRGGHRRYTPEDLARLARMRELLGQGVATADAARAVSGAVTGPLPGGPAAAPPTADRLTSAMHRLDAPGVSALVAAALDDRGASAAWTSVLAPALVAIGEHWAATGSGVEVEHLTSGIIAALLRYRTTVRDTAQAAPVVLLASCPAERHTLPLLALAAALAEQGGSGLVLDDLPPQALADAVVRVRPRAVVLWSRSPATADADCLDRALDAAGPVGAPVHPAGPGWQPAHLPAAAAPHLRDLPQALCLLGSREPLRPGPHAG